MVPFRLPTILQSACSPASGRFQAGLTASPVRTILANADDDFAERVEGVSNDFQPLQGDWVQIAPYGQFPHPRGLQYFAKADAEKLVANFGTLKAKLLRRFGGLPWYEGHPDTSPKDYPNKKAFGWVDNVEARDDGLYGHVKWTKAGQEMVNEGHYKYFSPVWHATPASVGGKPVLRPDELISVGFTNTPNMPVLPLSNEQEEQAPAPEKNDMKLPPFLKTFLGFDDAAEPDDEAIETAAQKKAEELTAKTTAANEADSAKTLLANERTAHATELENEKKSVSNLQKQLTDTATSFDGERHERIELIVASAVANGRITKADADKWKAELKEDFPGKSVELANVKPVLGNEVLTRDLGKQQASLEQGSTPAQQARALANEVVTKEGVGFEVAWQRIKKDRPDLFKGMKQPEGK